jgi:hypothetical protein
LAAMGKVPLPYSVGKEEVVSFHFAGEGVLGDAEVGIAIEEVVVPASVLVLNGSPRGVVFVSVHWVQLLLPRLIEALYCIRVFLHSHGDNQVVVPDAPSVAQHHCVLFR